MQTVDLCYLLYVNNTVLIAAVNQFNYYQVVDLFLRGFSRTFTKNWMWRTTEVACPKIIFTEDNENKLLIFR